MADAQPPAVEIMPASQDAGDKPDASTATALGDDDKYSDYIPQSGDLSRAPTASASASRVVSKAATPEPEAEEADEEDNDQQDGSNKGDSPSKTPRQLEKEREKVQRGEERKSELARRAAQNSRLDHNREAMQKSKLADSMKRFSYLLGQTELFQHFIDIKKERDPAFAKLLEESEKQSKKGKKAASSSGGGGGGNRRRKTEKEEDEELMKEDDEEEESFIFEESPAYVKGGTMRPYQVAGLNWMISLYHHGINGILADEMGLGKTLQTISFLGYLKFFRDTPRYHLVVVPKSTLDNWRREFAHWVPGFNVITLKGTKEDRADVIEKHLLPGDFDVLITTYEMCLREKSALKKLSWEYIVIDEAHRIKNVDSMLSQIVRAFTSRSRLLITGTPLQNNLMELWSLLNFLLPDVFSNSEDFESWFNSRGDDNQDAVVQQLHKVLKPFLLRRVKADVEKSLLPKKEINVFVGLTDMQRKWYKALLEKDIDAVNGAVGKKEGKTRLLNIVMQLRKCCNHPYLFDGAEPGPPYTTDQHLIDNSGKMIILDKLLASMKAKGSRVLIFSQMSRVLDLLEDYCWFREYEYCRIDGGTAHEDRIAAIDDYNKPGSDKFVFLLTTRAGGLGINLTTADVVVLFDSDWNPQADLQAMDRAHRIGQKKQVYVFRFVTEHAIEERILERAAQKLRLDQLVIQQGRAQQAQKAQQNKEELVDMIQHGVDRIISSKESMVVDDAIDKIIADGERRTEELQKRYSTLGLDELANFKSESGYEFEGTRYEGVRKKNFHLDLGKREVKKTQHFGIDPAQYEKKGTAPRAPKPKQQTTHDFQFFPQRLIELQERETAAYQKSVGYVPPVRELKEGETKEEMEEERRKEQETIEAAVELTEEEQAEKEELAQQGFSNWSRRDFQNFVKGCERHGRNAFSEIAHEFFPDGSKTEEDIEAYSEVFWKRVKELADAERVLQRIEEGEAKLAKQSLTESLLRKKVASYRAPLQQLKLVYNQNKAKSYSEDEDRFLLVRLANYGLSDELAFEKIKKDIAKDPAFRFDWFIKSRTAQELSRRCTTLLGLLLKDEPGFAAEVTKAGTGKGAPGKPRKRVASDAIVSSRGSTPAGGPVKKRKN